MKNFIKWLIDVDGMSWATFFIVIAQGFHYYHLFIGLGLFFGIANIIYATFLTSVLSIPLMIFTTKLGTIRRTKRGGLIEYEDRIENYQSAIVWYTIIDIIVNIYTWYNKLNVFLGFDTKYIPKYIVVTAIAILIPITLKKFAGEIKVK
jgi:hypothetical protein